MPTPEAVDTAQCPQSAVCRQTEIVTQSVHPYAGGGGGFRFEYEVASWFAVEMLLSRYSVLGGVIATLQPQAGPAGFDDLQLELELPDNGTRVVNVQTRSRQPFAAGDSKFQILLRQAATAVGQGRQAYSAGAKRLAIVVGASSPGHSPMSSLCDLARMFVDSGKFAEAVEARAGQVAQRWQHCLAASGLPADSLHATLSALEVHAFDLRSSNAPHCVQLENHLAAAWDPPDRGAAVALHNALRVHLQEIGLSAAVVDVASLQRNLTTFMPVFLGATTRRVRLARLKDAARNRIETKLRVLGVDAGIAESLAADALATAPKVETGAGISLLIGALGVGKTTELERLHARAIEKAMDEPNAPIPVKVDARDLVGNQVRAVIDGEVAGLGDPSRVGVHLAVDGADEVALGVDGIATLVSPLLALWPGTTVILASRSVPSSTSLEQARLEPMTIDQATLLMQAVDPHANAKWFRGELEEVLRRPLFAIRYALDRLAGNYSAIQEAQLVRSVGMQAVNEVSDLPDAFELLTTLACRIVDSGGLPVSLRDLGIGPVAEVRLSRSRILHMADGKASFQLAVLTEFFAADAIVHNEALRQRVFSNSVITNRWRYAIVQALTQASAQNVDELMATMLRKVPSTATWALHRALPIHSEPRTSAPADTAVEAGRRLQEAMQAWLEGWPLIAREFAPLGSPLPIGVKMDGPELLTVWFTQNVAERPPVAQLSAVFRLSDLGPGDWKLCQSGRPLDSELWPWARCSKPVLERIGKLLKTLEPVADVEGAWPELAWAYAHRIIKKNPNLASKPIARSDLERAIANQRSKYPEGDVRISEGMGQWRLSEAEAFVKDLLDHDENEVLPPWPTPDQTGRWISTWWSDSRLLDRLEATSKAALDIYQAVVDLHLPALAGELSTYQLLPARLVGTMSPGDPEGGLQDQTSFLWYLEPVPTGSANEARWVQRPDGTPLPSEYHAIEGRREALRRLRGDRASLIQLFTFGGEPDVFSATPASMLALRLLRQDLAAHDWVSGAHQLTRDGSAVAPLARP